MRSSEHHHNLNEHGEGKCSVPMWMDGCPAGFCDEPAFGTRPDCQEFRDAYGKLHRTDGRYSGYVPGLACPNHGGPTKEQALASAALAVGKGDRDGA